MTSTNDLITFAEKYYLCLRDSNSFLGGLEHGSFEMQLPLKAVHAATVSVAYGNIKEIRISYSNGIHETIRPQKHSGEPTGKPA